MATDNSPPQLKTILMVALIVVSSLVGLKFCFESYFIYMAEAAASTKRQEPVDLEKLHADEDRALTKSPMPIAQAMAEVSRGRSEQGGNSLIQPIQSDDVTPLKGWSKSPHEFDLPLPAAATDGGTTTTTAPTPMATDAGAPPPPRTDAGAHH